MIDSNAYWSTWHKAALVNAVWKEGRKEGKERKEERQEGGEKGNTQNSAMTIIKKSPLKNNHKLEKGEKKYRI